MTEEYTSYRGRLLRLSDERVEDFVADVTMVRALYEDAEISSMGLDEHAAQLREISLALEEDFSGDASDNKASSQLWGNLIDLSTRRKGLSSSFGIIGTNFLDAYAYTRTNRFLAAEFGGVENKSTMVLRAIANEVVERKLASRSQEIIKHFFSISFASEILDSVFPEIDTDTAHPLLINHLENRDNMPLPCFDPALARIISTLIKRGSCIVGKIPTEVRLDTMATSRGIFQDRGMRTPGARLRLIEWSEAKDADSNMLTLTESNLDDSYTENDEDLLTTDEAGLEGDEDILTVDKIKSFDIKKGNCHVVKSPGMSTELYLALRASMTRTMFPSDGVGVISAQQVCEECPVKKPCLEYALTNRIEQGMWGGESERSRRRLLYERSQAS